MLPKQHTRLNLMEIKAHIVRKIGCQNAEKYFDQLKRLFSFKLSKHEFNKFCFQIIGKENIPLHNRLIKSIIKNACLAKDPPVKPVKGSSLNGKATDGYQRVCLQSRHANALSPSPCKFRDLPSPHGPLGRPQSVVTEEEAVRQAPELESPTELISLGSRPPGEIASVEDGEEVEQISAGSPSVQSRSTVRAPLGISMNAGCAGKAIPIGVNSLFLDTCHMSGELSNTRSLHSRLEQRLKMEGLSMSLDSANILNNNLDAYLKRLIEPCIELAASRHKNEWLRQQNDKPVYASMSDFRVAMELNPQTLGGDWALQLEKICLRSFEEQNKR